LPLTLIPAQEGVEGREGREIKEELRHQARKFPLVFFGQGSGIRLTRENMDGSMGFPSVYNIKGRFMLLLVARRGDLTVFTRKMTEETAQVGAGPEW